MMLKYLLEGVGYALYVFVGVVALAAYFDVLFFTQ
jgi:hypothetical protein